jgi:hypothetical protein
MLIQPKRFLFKNSTLNNLQTFFKNQKFKFFEIQTPTQSNKIDKPSIKKLIV